MELLELKNKKVIDFYNDSDVTFWIRKLNVTHEQLTDAVIHTGSIYIDDIKKYIGIKDSAFSFSDFLGKTKTKN